MSDKKFAHEYNVEDLLKAIEGKTIDPVEKYDDPIYNFIQAFKIDKGKYLVHTSVLYKLFKLWHPDTAFNQRSFTINFSAYIEPFTTVPHKYKVNIDYKTLMGEIVDLKNPYQKTKSLKFQKHFQKFIEGNNITPGRNYIETALFFYIYNKWAKEHKYSVMFSEKTFADMCDLMFTKKHIGYHKNAYGLSVDILNLITTEEIQRWKQGRKKKNGRQKKQKG
jgi:hypothetical protein